MEDTSRDLTTGCAGDLPARIALRRQEAHEYMAAQQRRLGALETALAHKIGQITQELAHARQAALDTEAELIEDRVQLEATAKKLRLDERGLAQLRRENDANAEEMAYLRQRLQQKLAELDLDREKLSELTAQTKSQRRRIAHELKDQREKDRRWLERERAEIDQRRSALAESEKELKLSEQSCRAGTAEGQDRVLADVKRRYELAMEELREQTRRLAELEQRRAAMHEPDALVQQFDQQFKALQQTLLESVRGLLSEQRSDQSEVVADVQHRYGLAMEELREQTRHLAEPEQRRAVPDEPDALVRQLEEMRRRLTEAEERLKASELCPPEASEDQSQALADMQRRYEMAMEDLREQKRRVVELEKQPAAAARPAAAGDQGDKVDWETQKQRMLAALEADANDDDDDEDRRQERVKMREVVSRTDSAIADKDREIEELRRLLAAQSTNIGEVAVGAAAFADVLSADEIVRAERERLQQLQHEWEEKLRQAEIELSVQRARIARERAEIEERQRLFQDQQAAAGEVIGHDVGKPAKPQRGRWLSRLGLKDDEP